MIKGVTNSWLITITMVGAVLALVLVSPATSAEGQATLVHPPNATVANKTYAEWSAAWWQWMLALTNGANPTFSTTGSNCGHQQSGPVFFLTGAPSSDAYMRTQ